VVGAFWRTWIRLSQRLRKDATPAPESFHHCQSRITCTELNNLHHHCGNAILGIRLERKLALEALKSAKINKIVAAVHHLKYMDQHLARIERVLAAPLDDSNGDRQ